MCGIAGFFDASGAPPNERLLAQMSGKLAHRGPDEEGFLLQPGVGLASRRLKIIDLNGGSQPIFNEDRSVGVVYNGEIYNFQELRQQLEKRGHTFSTHTDTEVLVHLYEDRGEDFLEPVRGMFAVALWDAKRQIGLLARDRLGKKPVVYASTGGTLYFASEIQGLMPVSALPREVDLAAVGDYLEYGYIPAPATIFRAVRKLPPGHLLTWQAGDTRIKRYWQLNYQPKARLSEGEALAELEERLDEAVRIRLISDVPLGALLSGGVDSSTVVALMARHSSRVKTFSIGFEDPAFDELAHARRVAERYGTDHNEFVVEPNAAEVLPLLVRHYGEPYADSSAVPTYYVSRLAREHVTVVLNGDGGDEDFAGYDRYRAVQMAQWIQRAPGSQAAIAGAERLLGAASNRGLRVPHRVRRFLGGARLPVGERYVQWAVLLEPHNVADLLAPEVARLWGEQRSAAVERSLEANAHLHLVDRLLATDVATYLPFDLLVKMDIATMANSLETRSPLLDHTLVEFAASLPSRLKLTPRLDQKYLLKKLARKLIPAENIDRPKMGFGVPVGSWLRGPLREVGADALLGSGAQRGFLRADAVARLWHEHQARTRDHTATLWTLLMLELWCREFLDSPHESTADTDRPLVGLSSR